MESELKQFCLELDALISETAVAFYCSPMGWVRGSDVGFAAWVSWLVWQYPGRS